MTTNVLFNVTDIGVQTYGGFNPALPTSQYALVGRNSRDTLYNKTLTDPSNVVSASSIASNSGPVQISGNCTSGAIPVGTGTNAAAWATIPASVMPVTKTLYVDGLRTDAYTQTGSIQAPFKTIMGAVNQVIANGDNAINAYAISIVGAGTYNELIDLGNANIVNLTMVGSPAATVTHAGNVLQSLANNNAQSRLNFSDMYFNGNVQFLDTVNPGNAANIQFLFADCSITGSITTQNINYITFLGCVFQGDLTFINTSQAYFGGSFTFAFGYTTGFTVTTQAGPMPSGLIRSGSFALLEVSAIPEPMTISAGSEVDVTAGSGIGQNIFSSVNITVNGLLNSRGGDLGGNITVNSGGTLQAFDTRIRNTMTLNPGSTYQTSGAFLGNSVYLGNNLQIVTTGAGSPNGVLAAPPGSLYLNSSGGSGATLWVKESGTGNTGWVAK